MASDDDQGLSPASEDADELAADLPQQFSSVTRDAKEQPARKNYTLNRSSFRAVNTRKSPSASPARRSTVVAVEVPRPASDVEYERLPGYLTARNIWQQKRSGGETLYLVELQSREKEWVSLAFACVSLAKQPFSNSYCSFRWHVRIWRY